MAVVTPSGQHPYSVVLQLGLGAGTTRHSFTFFFLPGKLLALDLPGLAAAFGVLAFFISAESALTLSFSMTSAPNFLPVGFLVVALESEALASGLTANNSNQ